MDSATGKDIMEPQRNLARSSRIQGLKNIRSTRGDIKTVGSVAKVPTSGAGEDEKLQREITSFTNGDRFSIRFYNDEGASKLQSPCVGLPVSSNSRREPNDLDEDDMLWNSNKNKKKGTRNRSSNSSSKASSRSTSTVGSLSSSRSTSTVGSLSSSRSTSTVGSLSSTPSGRNVPKNETDIILDMVGNKLKSLTSRQPLKNPEYQYDIQNGESESPDGRQWRRENSYERRIKSSDLVIKFDPSTFGPWSSVMFHGNVIISEVEYEEYQSRFDDVLAFKCGFKEEATTKIGKWIHEGWTISMDVEKGDEELERIGAIIVQNIT